ncbi:MAG: Fe-S cluster assembly protein SufD [Aggregatilineales bacterium]
MTLRTRNKLIAPKLTREMVEQLSAAKNEPAWLLNARLTAWELYDTLNMPSMQSEAWRRTDYTTIRWEQAGRVVHGTSAGLEAIPAENLAPLIGRAQGGLIAAVDGKIVHSELSEALKAQGVIFCDFETAVCEHEALFRKHLMTTAVHPNEDKFAAMHAALWTHGVFLYVPRRTAVELPLHSLFYNTTSGLSLGHILVVLEEGAQVTYLHEYLSAEAPEHLAYVGMTELILGERANLRYVALQDWAGNANDIRHERARVAAGAQLDWIIGTMGGRFVKQFAEIELDGDGAFGRMSGLFFADGHQFFDHDTQQNHNAPHTTSDLLFKGALKDEARTVWQGMIKVLPHAQKTDGFQANRNLLLSPEARADSIPGLEIEANDVRCTHAATVGRLEDEPIFYLMSRGMTRQDAERLIVAGFFDPIMQRIPFEEVRARLTAHIEAKLERVAQPA